MHITRLLIVLLIAASAALPAAAQDVSPLARGVVNDLVGGNVQAVAARFTPTMAAALPAEKLATLWNQIVGQLGAFQRIEGVRTQKAAAGQLAEVTCEFEKASIVVRVAFGPDSRVSGLAFAPAPSVVPWSTPSYANEQAIEEREVTIGGLKLPATLTVPRGAKGPYPAVVLVHGSGPHDRDESIGGAKVFRDLAWGLATRGIAVLRYEKRTRVQPESFGGKPFTVNEEVIDDARQAISTLLTVQQVDRRRVFLLGHSLGATLAPRIAAADSRIAGIVMLAAAARPLEEVALEQIRYLTLNDPSSVAAAEVMVQQVRDPALAPAAPVDFLGSRLPGSYFLDLRNYNPTAVARSLNRPALIIHGGRDYQVTDADFALWTKALSDRPTVTLRRHDRLNHLMQEGDGPSRPEEYARPAHVAEAVITEIADWITRTK
jgi:dienelactone hydrolase